LIMSPDRGGIFDTLLGLVRVGLGGRHGNGKQYVSWVHYEDFVRAVYWLIEHEAFHGPVNIAAPNPIPNDRFMRALRTAWDIPIGLPATVWMLEVGTLLLRTESELVLKSRRVIPGRLAGAGFDFRFSDWDAAAVDLCQQWREARKND
jgi:NAD dependent epimerase/dehydratase family enzyme